MPAAYVKSFEDFKQRMATFCDKFGTLSQWFCKPLELSPPECARLGWKCASTDMLVCCACQKRLDCSISDSLSSQLRAKHTKELAQSLKEAHAKNCPWKIAPCPESHVVMEPIPKKDALTQFCGRFETLLCIGDMLPALIAHELDDAISGEQVSELVELCHASSSVVSWSAAILAMTGWEAGSGHALRKFIACDFCQRSVGTWLYLMITKQECSDASADTNEGETAAETESSVDSARTSVKGNGEDDSRQKEESRGTKRKHEGEDKFDPLTEHQAWCIWRRQDASGRQGWKIFVDSLLQNTTSRKTAVEVPPPGNVYIQMQKILDKLAAVKEPEQSS